MLLDLRIGVGVFEVEETKDYSLIDVGYECVLLLSSLDERWLEFNLTVLVQPLQVPILVLVLVEGLELIGAQIQLLRQLANKGVRLFRPMPIREYLSLELNPLDIGVSILLLVFVHQIFGQSHVREHL